nr:hypothetical protein LVJ77_05900 [Conchiformibius kuhniae]
MKQSSAVQPLLLIIAGALWFLKSMGWFPQTATLIALTLTATGVLLPVLEGINKHSVVAAPMLVYAGAAVFAYHHWHWHDPRPLIALGMVLCGCLMLAARSPAIAPRRPPELPLPTIRIPKHEFFKTFRTKRRR